MQRRKQSKISRTTDYIICDSVAKLPIARSRKLVVSEVILARQTPSPLCPTNGSPEARLIKLLSLCCCQVTDQLSLLRLRPASASVSCYRASVSLKPGRPAFCQPIVKSVITS